jgi:chemotaxis protein MotB
VPGKLYNELKAKKSDCDDENTALKATNLSLENSNKELQSRLADIQNELIKLQEDSLQNGAAIRRLQDEKTSLIASIDQYKKGGANDEATKQLIRDLQKTQENLQKREDEVKEKERLLNAKRDSLFSLTGELRSKDARLNELERLINSKDSVVKALKNTVTKALIGFKDQGLSIEQKNGKVYVMLEERLLFATGSIVVDQKGVGALVELGKVLEKNPDINILIEGHTDNVPMKGNGEIKDNWDLSVMRATSVVKIITSNSKVLPSRLTAAGRGEYVPIDRGNSADAKKKNRRIEVILTPKLDEIFKVLETN